MRRILGWLHSHTLGLSTGGDGLQVRDTGDNLLGLKRRLGAFHIMAIGSRYHDG